MIGRRTFIQGTALVATAPVLANLLSLSSTAQSPPSGPLPPQLAARTDMNCVVFKIDGWDRCDDMAIDGSKISSADPGTNDPTGEQVLISINQSWRTAWR
jgi:hypothetical protein